MVKAIVQAFNAAQNYVNKNGVGTVTFVLCPNWWVAKAEADWTPKDITCITPNKDLAIKPAAEKSSSSPFDVGGGLDASKSKRMFSDFSHKLVTTIQNAATETV